MSTVVTILHVDDDPLTLWAFQRLFRKNDLIIFPAHDGFEALNMLKHREVDLAILDVSMPHWDGFGVLEALRRIDPDMPVIFLTGSQDERNLYRAIEVGCHAYIEKPSDPRQLKSQIQQVIYELRKQRDRLPTVHTKS